MCVPTGAPGASKEMAVINLLESEFLVTSLTKKCDLSFCVTVGCPLLVTEAGLRPTKLLEFNASVPPLVSSLELKTDISY